MSLRQISRHAIIFSRAFATIHPDLIYRSGTFPLRKLVSMALYINCFPSWVPYRSDILCDGDHCIFIFTRSGHDQPMIVGTILLSICCWQLERWPWPCTAALPASNIVLIHPAAKSRPSGHSSDSRRFTVGVYAGHFQRMMSHTRVHHL